MTITPEQYKAKMAAMQARHEQEKMQAAKRYALENNPYNKGDKITDHMGSIIIEDIYVSYHGDLPKCVYRGPELKKDGTPKLTGVKRQVYQSNIVLPA